MKQSVTYNSIVSEQDKILLLASRLELDSIELQALNDLVMAVTDWKSFSGRILSSGSSSLMYKNFIKLPGRDVIPVSLLAALKKKYTRIFFENSLRYRDLEKVVKAFNENNIGFIPLKGILLAQIMYKDIGLRNMCDMDILVKEKDVEQCRELVLSLGWNIKEKIYKSDFVAEQLEHQHPYTFLLGNSAIELHDDLHSNTVDYKIDVRECWERAGSAQFLKGSCLVFSAEDMILHLCTHLCRHIIKNSYNIKHYCDIAEFLRMYQHRLNWEQLVYLSKKYNCWEEVRQTLLICNDYFNAPVNRELLRAEITDSEIDYAFLFINFFQGNEKQIDNYLDKRYNSTLSTIRQINGKTNKLRYILNSIFPGREFMIKRYKIKNKALVYIYYPVRVGAIIGRLFRLI